MKLSVLITSFLFQILFCQNSFAQIELSQFDNLTHYDIDDGISTTSISDIKEDKDGFIWLATEKGISRFDGSHFTNFEYYDEDSVVHKIERVNTLYIDDINNRLWIGGKNGIFYTSIENINIKKFNQWTLPSNIKYPSVKSFLKDNKNQLWVGGLNGLLSINLNNLKQDIFNPLCIMI